MNASLLNDESCNTNFSLFECFPADLLRCSRVLLLGSRRSHAVDGSTRAMWLRFGNGLGGGCFNAHACTVQTDDVKKTNHRIKFCYWFFSCIWKVGIVCGQLIYCSHDSPEFGWWMAIIRPPYLPAPAEMFQWPNSPRSTEPVRVVKQGWTAVCGSSLSVNKIWVVMKRVFPLQYLPAAVTILFYEQVEVEEMPHLMYINGGTTSWWHGFQLIQYEWKCWCT